MQMQSQPGAPAPASAGRPGLILVVLCAAAFMASLDVFIVNVAFPDIGHDFHGASLSQPELDPERLHDRVRRAAGARSGASPTATAARPGFVGGLALFTVGERGLRVQHGPLDARRVPRPPGSRGRSADPDEPRAAARRRRRPSAVSVPCASGPPPARSLPPSARSSAACSCRPRGAGCSSSTCRSASSPCVAAVRHVPRLPRRERAAHARPGRCGDARRGDRRASRSGS